MQQPNGDGLLRYAAAAGGLGCIRQNPQATLHPPFVNLPCGMFLHVLHVRERRGFGVRYDGCSRKLTIASSGYALPVFPQSICTLAYTCLQKLHVCFGPTEQNTCRLTCRLTSLSSKP